MLQEHTNMIGNVDFYCEMTVSLVYFSHSFLFQLQINENNRNINSHKQIKINLVRVIWDIELYRMKRKRSHHSRGKC